MKRTHRVRLADGFDLVARRPYRVGRGSLVVELLVHHQDLGRPVVLDSARWNPDERVLRLRDHESRAAITQHGVSDGDLDVMLGVIADELGFPAVDWSAEEHARDGRGVE